MLYLINSHFRVQLNVGSDQPFPTLKDFLSQEDRSANEKLKKIDRELQDAMVRDDILFVSKDDKQNQSVDEQEDKELGRARSKLNKWFPG